MARSASERARPSLPRSINSRARNPTKWPRFVLDQELIENSREALGTDLRALAGQFPEIDQSLWPSASL